MQGYTDSIDIQLSSSNKRVGEKLQIELENVLEQTYYSHRTAAKLERELPLERSYNKSSLLSKQSIIVDEEAPLRFYPNAYGIVTDTVSFLPYVGIWDIEAYNGVKRIIGQNGKLITCSSPLE